MHGSIFNELKKQWFKYVWTMSLNDLPTMLALNDIVLLKEIDRDVAKRNWHR
jgi:hypothetical protein